MALEKLRIQRCGAFELLFGHCKLTAIKEDIPQIVMGEGILFVEMEHLLISLYRLFLLADCQQGRGAIDHRIQINGIDRQCFIDIPQGLIKIPLGVLYGGHVGQDSIRQGYIL